VEFLEGIHGSGAQSRMAGLTCKPWRQKMGTKRGCTKVLYRHRHLHPYASQYLAQVRPLCAQLVLWRLSVSILFTHSTFPSISSLSANAPAIRRYLSAFLS
jgi:hypothetical protein